MLLEILAVISAILCIAYYIYWSRLDPANINPQYYVYDITEEERSKLSMYFTNAFNFEFIHREKKNFFLLELVFVD